MTYLGPGESWQSVGVGEKDSGESETGILHPLAGDNNRLRVSESTTGVSAGNINQFSLSLVILTK